jgi:hypothetical protein
MRSSALTSAMVVPEAYEMVRTGWRARPISATSPLPMSCGCLAARTLSCVIPITGSAVMQWCAWTPQGGAGAKPARPR